jgi:hypothetical protein
MKTSLEQAATARLQLAFELFDLAERMMRTKLRRRHPDESPEQIEGRLNAWLVEDSWAPPGTVLAPHRFSQPT